jgi:hypothetical protein
MRFIAMLAFLASFAFACSASAENNGLKPGSYVEPVSSTSDTSGWWACPVEKDLIDRGERGLTIYGPRYFGGDSRYPIIKAVCWTGGLTGPEAIPAGSTGRLIFSVLSATDAAYSFLVSITQAPHNYRSAAEWGADYLAYISSKDVAPKTIGPVLESRKTYWDVVPTDSVSYEVEYDRGSNPKLNLNVRVFFTHFAYQGKNFWCAVRVGTTLGLDADAINETFLRSMLGSFLGKGAPSVVVSQQ